VTVDTYGQLIPEANVSFVNLEEAAKLENEPALQPRRNLRKAGRMSFLRKLLIILVAAVGLEPTTYGL
jgi:hypothetical protein